MNITLDKTEAETLMQLLDIATKAGGLQAASLALPIAVKVSDALRSEEQPQPAAE